jgi:siroheme synthase-like protein
MLPILVDLRDRGCVVVGGGPVGVRKAATLLEAGAAVSLVCLEAPPERIADRLRWRTEPYRAETLRGVSLVVAAATPAVNAQVVADARARGIWVNSTGEPEAGDFTFPAVAVRGRVRVAVSTGGGSPGLAAVVRDRLRESVDDSVVAWVDLVADIRRELRARLPAERRADVLRRLAEPAWLDRIRAQGPEAVRRAMRAVVDEELGR